MTQDAHPHLDASVTTGRAWREPTLPLLVLTSVAMLRRGYLPDLVIFVGATALVAVDATRWHLRTSSARPATPAAHRGRGLLAALLLAAAVAVLPQPSPWQDLAFAVIGVVVLALVWTPAPRAAAPASSGSPARWWVWPGLGVGLGLVELCSFLFRSDPMVDAPGHPTLSTLLEPALGSGPLRLLAVWGWLLVGWWLVRRVRAWAS